VPLRPANLGTARGGLAADRRAPHVSDFPILENLENQLSTQEKIQGAEKSEKIHGGRK
jgi:hypothetical protein